MILDLPESSEALMKTFKSKLRSQIRKPMREGLKARIGGLDLIDAFYKVFLKNMRDLGSPVHSKKLMENLLVEFPDKAMIFVVYKDRKPVAGSFVCSFRKEFINPWASFIREYSQFSPNMLLYWAMLEYACDHGFSVFDFGRSTPGEGTFKFKEQWGARPVPLCWLELSNEKEFAAFKTSVADKSKFDIAIQLWKKLPVPLSRILGPAIRKNIGL
jgi:FemAB-related protein (PEP-CTERM system-associated)